MINVKEKTESIEWALSRNTAREKWWQQIFPSVSCVSRYVLG